MTGQVDPHDHRRGLRLIGPGEPYTCTHCGCLCDDLEPSVQNGRIVKVANACAIGRRFLIGQPTAPQPASPPRVHGVAATAADALEAAAGLLRRSRGPIVLGLDRSTNETVRQAVALADAVGAALEIGDGRGAWNRIAAMQRAGAVGATLGEVKARADVLVFWGCDPATTHPRHFERFSINATGRFVEEGLQNRRVVVVDETETPTAALADEFLLLPGARELDLLHVLRALAADVPLDPRRVEQAVGHGLDQLQGIVEILRAAGYGAWFQGEGAGRGPVGQEEARRIAVTGLMRELNRRTRFVALGLGAAGNAHGAEGVLAWQTGFAPGVDLGSGFPESLPGESSAVGRLERCEFDVAVVVGEHVFERMSDVMKAQLSRKPWIYVGGSDSAALKGASAAFPASAPGVDDSGTFVRVDGVSLPVRAIRPPGDPSEGVWLELLRNALATTKAGAP